MSGSQGTAAGAQAGASDQAGRRCARFGCLEEAAWIVSDSQGGELPACEVDLDVFVNDALSGIPLDSAVRVEVWGAQGAG
jgi:hypothetical protein